MAEQSDYIKKIKKLEIGRLYYFIDHNDQWMYVIVENIDLKIGTIKYIRMSDMSDTIFEIYRDEHIIHGIFQWHLYPGDPNERGPRSIEDFRFDELKPARDINFLYIFGRIFEFKVITNI